MIGEIAATSQETNIWIAKYNSSLVLQASVTINGSANSYDGGFNIISDSSGNILAIGYVTESLGAENIWLAKYNSSLTLLASTTFNGPAGGYDSGSDIAVDSSGYVWATGLVSKTSEGRNAWIARYTPSLILLASTTMNSSANGSDIGNSIEIDSAGNPWVTGQVEEISGGVNIWMAKYTPLLVLTASASINGSANSADVGKAIAFDSSGNAWVTGQIVESSGGYNLWIAKWDSSLVLKTNATVNGSGGNSLDSGLGIYAGSSGNILITGYLSQTSTKKDIWIAQYDATLNLQKNVLVNGSISGQDSGRSIAIDSSGNIFTTGSIYGESGNNDIWVAKFNSSLIFEASATVSGSANGYDAGEGITIDSSGNVWVIGSIDETLGENNIWIGKFSPSLVLQTSTTFNGTANSDDEGIDIALNSAGNIIVSGNVSEPSQSHNAWIAVYSPSLTLLLSKTINGPANGFDEATDIALDSSDNVWVAGGLKESNGDNLWIAKFSSSLILLASTTINGSANGYDSARRIIVDASSNVWVAGEIEEIDGGINAWFAKYSLSLVLQASATVNGSSGGADLARTIGVDPLGSIFIGGEIGEGGGNKKLWVAQYSSSFTLVSSVTIAGPVPSYANWIFNLAVDTGSTVWAIGNIFNGSSKGDIWISKHSGIPSQQVDGNQGATIAAELPKTHVVLEIPPFAFEGSFDFTIKTPASLPAINSSAASLLATGVGVDISLDQQTQPKKEVGLSMTYQDSDVSGVNENHLVIARYDTGKNVWVPLASSVDTVNNKVTAQTNHFSTFQIMQAIPAANVGNPKIFPNPFQPSLGHLYVTFSNLPEGATIKIYTLTGGLVREITAGAGGLTSWDAKNISGENVASGVYFGLVEGASGKKILKVAVQR